MQIIDYQYEGQQDVMTIFNVSDWQYVELKTLLIFIILERFGDDFLNQGSNFLNIKLTQNDETDDQMIDMIKNKLSLSHGDELKIGDINHNIIAIDLTSWSQ